MKRWMMRIVGISMLLGAGLAQAAYTNLVPTTTYDGTGALSDVANWDSGLPTNGNPGLVVTADGTSTLATWRGIEVRQEGGTFTGTNHGLQGGDDAVPASIQSIFEIDDLSNTGFGYKNLDLSGLLTLWDRNSGTNTLSVLNGYADVGGLACTKTTANFINILNGRLDVGYLSNGNLTMNMLAGGTGEVNLADQAGGFLDATILNFETGSEASFTIASNGVATAQGYWETKIAASQVRIDGVAVTGLGAFVIENVDALGTKISVSPYYWSASTIYDDDGGLNQAVNWSSGLPTNGSPGLIVDADATSTLGTAWYGYTVRQQGGQITQAGDFGLRGGINGVTGSSNLLEVADAHNTDFAYTNLAVSGTFTMWKKYPTGNTLSVLDGYVTLGALSALNNTTDNTINIGSGKLDIASLLEVDVQVNMLSGGDGQIVVDDVNGDNLTAMKLDFASDSAASFTLLQDLGGSTAGYWEALILLNRVSIGGVVDNNTNSYFISSTGGNDTTIQTYAGIAFPAPEQGPDTSANLIPNGEFDQVVDRVDDGATHSSGWYNITNSFGTFDPFDGDYARAENWEYSAEDPNLLTTHLDTILTNSFYIDALVNSNENNANGQLTFNALEDYRHIMTQADALSAATIDAGATYRLSVDALAGQSGTSAPETGTFTVELTDGGGQIAALSDTVIDWTGVRTVDISGDELDNGSVNVVFDMIGTNSIPGYPATAPHNDGSLIAKLNVYEISLVEVYEYSVYDVNQDGVIDQADVDLANSYLDGSVDGGADAATRQALLTDGGLTDAQALAALNLTAFDVNGDGVFDATDVDLIENPTPPSIISGVMDGSGDFVVTFDSSSVGSGTTLFLKRSQDLVFGPVTNIVDSAVTAGSTLVLTDTNAPAGQAFYQVTD